MYVLVTIIVLGSKKINRQDLLFLFLFFFFLLEREAEGEERESLVRGPIPQTWDHDLGRNQEADAQPSEPPRLPPERTF